MTEPTSSPVVSSEPLPEPEPKSRLSPRAKRVLWQGKIGPAFWTLTSLISMTINIVLVVALLALGRQLFGLKALIEKQLIGGLYENFQLMDQAHIMTTILVSDTIQVIDTIHVVDTMPVIFDLPLSQDTQVILTEDTPIQNATIYLNGAPINLNIVLPEGTPLAINLDMIVPVSQTIPVSLKVPVVLNVPVNLKVPVDIALDQTELHEPFVGLQQVVQPYQGLLGGLPDSWEQACGPRLKGFCKWLFK